MKKRTKQGHFGHGPLGCPARIALARDRFRRVLSDSHFCFPAGGTFPDSRTVRALPALTGFVRFFTSEGAGHFVLERSERVRLVLAITPMKNGKARTLRTKHGPLGCHGDIVLRPRHCAERRLS